MCILRYLSPAAVRSVRAGLYWQNVPHLARDRVSLSLWTGLRAFGWGSSGASNNLLQPSGSCRLPKVVYRVHTRICLPFKNIVYPTLSNQDLAR